MISIIIPTFNRVNEIKKTFSTYLDQCKSGLITEFIVINDRYQDRNLLDDYFNAYPLVKLIHNKKKKGALKNKVFAAQMAKGEYVFFGEDDAYLSANYIKTIYDFFIKNPNLKVGVVSGSIIYMKPEEEYLNIMPSERLTQNKIFDYNLLKFNPYGRLVKDVNRLPFTHALFLTKRDLFLKYYDESFLLSKGNGYREETVFQIKIWLEGYENFILKKTSCFHLNKKDVLLGGQNQSNRFKKLFWTCVLNYYFLNKYFIPYKEKTGIQGGFFYIFFLFIYDEFNQLFLRPIKRRIYRN